MFSFCFCCVTKLLFCGCHHMYGWVISVSNCVLVLQMRGTDWQVYSEATGELRLGLLLHILDLCEFSFSIFVTQGSCVLFIGYMYMGGAGISWHVRFVYCVLDHCTFKKQLPCRADYSCHGYMDVCQFVYCSLSRSRKIGSPPSLNEFVGRVHGPWET